MKSEYSDEVDILDVFTEEDEATGAGLLRQPGVDIFLGTEDGYDIVGFHVVGGSAVLPLGKMGYDAGSDTLTLGETTEDPARVSANGDLTAFWEPFPGDTDERMNPIGVSLRRASVHLAPAIRQFEAAQKRGKARNG